MTQIVFILKDKFSFIYDGYEKFHMVDVNEEKIYDIDKMNPRNVYLWTLAKNGDQITAKLDGKRLTIDKLN